MADADTSRLYEIYKSLRQQYAEKSAPLIILSSIESEDVQYLRENIDAIFKINDDSWCRNTLLVYVIADFVYENYAEDRSENVNLWPLLNKYLIRFYPRVDRDSLINLIKIVLNHYHMRIIKDGKQYQNTVLLHSSSKHYSKAFFDYIARQYYRCLGMDIDYDLVAMANTISEEFSSNDTTMPNAFSLLMGDSEVFPSIFEMIIRKIDQRNKGELEIDLGRWEEAFDEWYNDKNSRYTHNKAEVSLIEENGDYVLKIVFPSNEYVPEKYNIKLAIGEDTYIYPIKVGNKRGIPISQEKTCIFHLQDIDILESIYATDSEGTVLLDMPKADYRVFNNLYRYVKNISSGQYRFLIKDGVEHNLNMTYTDNVTESISIIEAIVDSENHYHIGNNELHRDRNTFRNGMELLFPPLGDIKVSSEEWDIIVPKHPTIRLSNGVDEVSVSIRGFDGRFVLNEVLNPGKDHNEIDLNDLIPNDSGVFRIALSSQGCRLVSSKYLLIKDLSYDTGCVLNPKTEGDINAFYESHTESIHYNSERYVEHKIKVNGKTIKLNIQTPALLFNPQAAIDPDYWIRPDSATDEICPNDIVSISMGCLTEGSPISLLIRTNEESYMAEDFVFDGICTFNLKKCIKPSVKEITGLELLYDNGIIPLFSKGLGKYDIEIQNKLLIVTPYCMPPNCRTRYEYFTYKENKSGYLELNNPLILDLDRPHFMTITETDTSNGTKRLIYTHVDGWSRRMKEIPNDRVISDKEMANWYLSESCDEHNIPNALDILKKLTNQHDPEATLELARIYLSGTIVKRDLKTSTELLKAYTEKKAGENAKL